MERGAPFSEGPLQMAAEGRPGIERTNKEDAQRGSGLLIDACCGPCALAMEMVLQLDREGCCLLFYNPNVHPFSEYRKRLETFLGYVNRRGFRHRVLPYEPEEWLRAVAFHEDERCERCYRLRLSRLVCFAQMEGFDAVSTTLLASPHQDHELIASLGESLAAEAGLRFLAWDGRDVYREALREARLSGMFTQAWCGCLLSERERYDRDLRRRGADGLSQ